MTIESILRSEDVIAEINNNLPLILGIIPDLKSIINFCSDNNIWEHTLLTLGMAPADLELRLVILLHDIGATTPKQDSEGKVYLQDTNVVSSIMARRVLKSLNYEEAFINEVCYLIVKYNKPITKEETIKNPDLASKRYLLQYYDSLACTNNKSSNLKRTKDTFDEID